MSVSRAAPGPLARASVPAITAGTDGTVDSDTATRAGTRLVTARGGTPLVPRSRLDGRYADATGRLLRVLAPGGYGKSTLVRRWVSDDARAVRWLDLERIDNDPSVLIDAVAEALSDLAGGAVDELPPATCGPREFSGLFLPAVGSLVRSCDAPFVLVLDDVHHVDAPKSTAIIETVARDLPDASTLVVAGLAHHAGESIGRLRLSPGVVDVTLDDLAFDLAETEEMLAGCGVQLDVGGITEIDGLLEGWPAALRLAALVIRATGDASPRTMDDIAGSPYLVDYLRSEWLDRLTSDETRFLGELACLGDPTGEMCDAVLGRRGSSTLLEHLHRHHSVVTPLDHRGESYRMHPLLARWFSSELETNDREHWRRVHAHAARWHARVGKVDLAIDHATHAGSRGLHHDLITSHAPGLLGGGSHREVLGWLDALPPDDRRASAHLCALTGVAHFLGGEGEQALRWSRVASRHTGAGSGAPGPGDGAAPLGEIVGAAIEPRPAPAAIGALEQARQHLTGGFWQAFACWALGGAMFVDGDERGAEILAEGAFEGQVIDAHALRAACLVTRGIVLDLGDDRDSLAEAVDIAAGLVGRYHLQPSLATSLVGAARCVVEARDGERQAAIEHVKAARSDLSRVADVAPWYHVVARVALVRALLLIDDAAAAQDVMREIDGHLRGEDHRSGRPEPIASLAATVAAANRLLANRSWALTAAELNVIRFLPTNLSLADIGARLFVSRNTVKSHVAAIYRKLGTSSRSHAVDLAREAGFLAD